MLESVADESSNVAFHSDGQFAHAGEEFHRTVHRLVRCSGTSDDLDDRDEVRRVPKVHADRERCIVEISRDRADRDDRGVRRENGGRICGTQFGEESALDIEVLDDSLDHEVDIRDGPRNLGINLNERLVAGAHRPGVSEGRVEHRGVHVGQGCPDPGARHEPCDATAHEPGADDGDGRDRALDLGQHAV